MFTSQTGPRKASELFDAIPHRQSTSADYGGRAVSPVGVAAMRPGFTALMGMTGWQPDINLAGIIRRHR